MYVHYNIIAHLLLAVLIVFITQLMCSRVVKVKIGYTKTMVTACYQNYICSIVSSKTVIIQMIISMPPPKKIIVLVL